MPVFEQSYRHYEGGLRHKFRWWIVVEQEFRVLAKSRVFKGLVLLAGLHYIVRVLQVVGYDVIVQDPNHPMAALLSQVEGLVVNARTADGQVMGVRHATLPIHGVQFHPESIATEHGHAMLANFMRDAGMTVRERA